MNASTPGRREDDAGDARAARRLNRALDLKRRELELVRLCQEIHESKRAVRGSEIYLECGYVYLMEKLARVREPYSITYVSTPSCPHKIGATMRRMSARSRELWNRKRLILRAKYATVIPFLLEEWLHRHFVEFRVTKGQRKKGERINLSGELFRLPRREIDEFSLTVTKVEKWALAAEEARLALEIMRLEGRSRFDHGVNPERAERDHQ
jgi:hypothetical protein